jgi:hypothetical protein
MATQVESVLRLPNFYISGLIVSNDATTPNTKLDISAGICRDSNNSVDMGVGVNNPNADGKYIAAPLIINAATTGVNALDTGTLAASTLYAVYLISDSRGYQDTAAILTLASNSAPLMPFGYDTSRLIAYWATDGSVHFLKGYVSGNNNERMFTYDAPQATSVTAGAATSYTGVALTTLVPPVENTPVMIQTDFTANAAADILNLQGFDSTGDAVHIVAPVAGATAHTWTASEVLAQLNTAAPSIKYKVSSGSAAVAIDVASYKFSV